MTVVFGYVLCYTANKMQLQMAIVRCDRGNIIMRVIFWINWLRTAVQGRLIFI